MTYRKEYMRAWRSQRTPEDKQRESEYRKKWHRDHPQTPEYRRNGLLKHHYGMTHNDYLNLLEAQDGRCAICGTKNPGKQKHFHVDHDHYTSNVRGLLCSNCNVGLGMFSDDPILLFSAMRYIEKRRYS